MNEQSASIIPEAKPGDDWKTIVPLGELKDTRTLIEKIEDEGGNMQDPALITAGMQALELSTRAESMIIKTNDDLKAVTDDLVIIAKIKKGVEEKLDGYVKPLKDYIKEITARFSRILGPLEKARIIYREKSNAYNQELKRQQQEAEEINRQKVELAHREAAFNKTGEFTVDTTPVTPPAAIKRVRSDIGSMTVLEDWRWEPVDINLVPREYLMLDTAKITRSVKREKVRIISGLRIWDAGNIKITQR